MIKVLKQDTADEAEQLLDAGLNKMAQMQAEQQQQQQESDQKVAQITEEGKEKDREINREEIKAKIDVAKINAGAKLDIAEMYSDDVRDTTSAKEKGKVFLENSKMEQAKNNFKNSQRR